MSIDYIFFSTKNVSHYLEVSKKKEFSNIHYLLFVYNHSSSFDSLFFLVSAFADFLALFCLFELDFLVVEWKFASGKCMPWLDQGML